MSSQVKLYIADIALPLESPSSAFSADKAVHVGQENEKSGEPRLESDLEKISPYRDRKSGTITRENGRKSFLSTSELSVAGFGGIVSPAAKISFSASRRRSASLAIDGGRQGDDLVECSAVLRPISPLSKKTCRLPALACHLSMA